MAEAAVDSSKSVTKADKILAALDSLNSRVDSIEKKADERAAADASKRKDGDLALEVKPKENEPVQGGDNPPKVADKKKDAKGDDAKRADRDKDMDTSVSNVTKGDAATGKRADWDDDDDKDKKDDAAKADAKRKDAGGGWQNEGKEGQDPPKDPDWDKKDSKADARADSYVRVKASDWDRINGVVSALEQERNMPEEKHSAYADTQGHWDTVAQMFGKQAPRWLTGESQPAYDRRLATMFRPYSKAWADVKMSELPDGAFRNAREQIYSDAMHAAHNPTDLGPGEERKVVLTDPDTGQKQIVWRGGESFIKGLGRPGRRVVSFLTRADAR